MALKLPKAVELPTHLKDNREKSSRFLEKTLGIPAEKVARVLRKDQNQKL